jgi:hypothetical protein
MKPTSSSRETALPTLGIGSGRTGANRIQPNTFLVREADTPVAPRLPSLTLFLKFLEGSSYRVVNAAELGAGGKAHPKPILVGGTRMDLQIG